MAMEIKTVNCNNEDEESTIRLYQDFGWTFKSSQRVFNKSSHLESRSDGTYSVTETTDFTKLVFERDTAMPHYAELKKLEEQYHQVLQSLPEDPGVSSSVTPEEWARWEKPDVRASMRGLWFELAFIGVSVLGIVIFYNSTSQAMTNIGGFSFAGGILGGVIYWKLYQKISKAVALHQAIQKPDSKAHEVLESLFKPLHDQAVQIKEGLASMEKIRRDAADLVS